MSLSSGESERAKHDGTSFQERWVKRVPAFLAGRDYQENEALLDNTSRRELRKPSGWMLRRGKRTSVERWSVQSQCVLEPEDQGFPCTWVHVAGEQCHERK